MRRNFFRLWNNAKEVLHDATPAVLVAMARTAGKIAEIGGGTFGESFMQHEVPWAIDLLSADQSDPGRFGGVLLLTQLARNSPTQFHAYIGDVLDKILYPIRDRRVSTYHGFTSV